MSSPEESATYHSDRSHGGKRLIQRLYQGKHGEFHFEPAHITVDGIEHTIDEIPPDDLNEYLAEFLRNVATDDEIGKIAVNLLKGAVVETQEQGDMLQRKFENYLRLKIRGGEIQL